MPVNQCLLHFSQRRVQAWLQAERVRDGPAVHPGAVGRLRAVGVAPRRPHRPLHPRRHRILLRTAKDLHGGQARRRRIPLAR